MLVSVNCLPSERSSGSGPHVARFDLSWVYICFSSRCTDATRYTYIVLSSAVRIKAKMAPSCRRMHASMSRGSTVHRAARARAPSCTCLAISANHCGKVVGFRPSKFVSFMLFSTRTSEPQGRLSSVLHSLRQCRLSGQVSTCQLYLLQRKGLGRRAHGVLFV